MYCQNCGAEIEKEGDDFCRRCGIQNSALPESPPSGFCSTSIRKKIVLGFQCFGLYATNRRIFIVRAPFKIQFRGVILPLIASSFIIAYSVLDLVHYPELGRLEGLYTLSSFAFFFLLLSSIDLRDSSQVSIEQLEKRGAMQIQRNEISQIEFSDGGLLFPSKIVIVTKEGKRKSIWFAEKGGFNGVVEILRKFVPEIYYAHVR